MSLSVSILANLIKTNLQAQGANGSNLSSFCTAIATGIINSIVGVSFTTTDVGMVSNNGTGTGIGITGLSSSSMASTALATMTSQGTNASNLMTAIMSATVSHLSSSANLSSTDFPVYSGTGTIDIGSINVNVSTMSSNIDTQLQSSGANGSNRSNLALSIATGIVNNILSSGTGTLTITGTPPGSPSPGSGTGTGTIS